MITGIQCIENFAISEDLQNTSQNFLHKCLKTIFCWKVEIAAVQKYANLVDLNKSCQTHILLQNFVLIQPRTSPPKNCKMFEKCIFRKCIFRKFCKCLAGSFSAVSKRNFARKYAFDSIFQALKDLHTFAPLQSQNFTKKIGLNKQQISWKFSKNFANVVKSVKFCQISKFSDR